MTFNQTILVGNVGRDPELRMTNDGVEMTNFTLAVNARPRKDDQEERKPMWITVIAWRGLAKTVAAYVKKGTPILVSGELSIRTYTNKANAEKTAVEIIAEDIVFLGGKKQNDAEPVEEQTA